MRKHPVVTLSLAAAALAACDTANPPTVAAVAGMPTVIVGVPIVLLISPARIRIPIGTTAQLSTNATNAVIADVVWASSQPSIVAVSQDGTVLGLAFGSSIITARLAIDPTIVATAIVEVAPTAPPP
jgi:hypothetical protein